MIGLKTRRVTTTTWSCSKWAAVVKKARDGWTYNITKSVTSKNSVYANTTSRFVLRRYSWNDSKAMTWRRRWTIWTNHWRVWCDGLWQNRDWRRQRGLPPLFSLLSWTILFDFRGCPCRTSPTRWLKTRSIAWCSLTRISWSTKVWPSTWLSWKISVAAGGRSMGRNVSMLWKIWSMIQTLCAHPWIREMICVWPDVWPWYGIATKAPIVLEICGGCATTGNGGPAKRTLCVCQREWNTTCQLGKTPWKSLRHTSVRKGSRSARSHWIMKTPCFSRATPGREQKWWMWCWWMAITCSSRTWHGTSTRITFVICVAHRSIGVCAIVAGACKHETCTECQRSEGRTLQCPVCKR